MTNEEAKVFLDNLKICINEHPIVADWLVEIADRKTKPTISKMEQVDEPQRDCFLCKWLGDVDVCGRCRNRNLFAEADTEPKPKDEPQTEYYKYREKIRPHDPHKYGFEDEPQTERSE